MHETSLDLSSLSLGRIATKIGQLQSLFVCARLPGCNQQTDFRYVKPRPYNYCGKMRTTSLFFLARGSKADWHRAKVRVLYLINKFTTAIFSPNFSRIESSLTGRR